MSCLEEIPQNFLPGVQGAAAAIPELRKLILAAHVNLDGDALGSLSAMAHILKALGKECFIYSCTGIPDYLKFFQLPCGVYENLEYLPFTPEGAIYLDCGEPQRLGKALAEVYANWPSINIDHHLGDGGMGTLVNCIYPEAAATAQLVTYIAMILNLPLQGGLADSIALGLITDTGSFCHGNLTAGVLELCASLLRNGCNLYHIREKLYNNWSVDKLRLWGKLFMTVDFLADREVALCVVSREEIEHFHCKSEDLEGLVEKFRKIKNIKISAILREEKDGFCKFSMRSSGNIDVRAIALKAGGGGHQNAAGGALHLPLHEAREVLRKLLEDAVKYYH